MQKPSAPASRPSHHQPIEKSEFVAGSGSIRTSATMHKPYQKTVTPSRIIFLFCFAFAASSVKGRINAIFSGTETGADTAPDGTLNSCSARAPSSVDELSSVITRMPAKPGFARVQLGLPRGQIRQGLPSVTKALANARPTPRNNQRLRIPPHVA
ncbi:hypothetical protein ACQKKX_18590 [Neorhizobium sp. NPDC001467]|uniref:hypothetical protein n=1 Tax=Neorhizobium sp. NPDC001467 TaxID=3390595 RepID=UPI003D079DB8